MTGGKKAHRARPQSKMLQRLQRLHSRHLRLALVGLITTTSLAMQPTMNALQQVRESGELHLVGISNPATFFEQDGHTHGLQYELAQQFANELGVKLVVDPVDNAQEVLKRITRNNAQLALTTINASDPSSNRLLRMSDPLQELSQQLIQRSDQSQPSTINDLHGKVIAVMSGSSEAINIRSSLSQVNDVQLVELKSGQAIDLLNLLDAGQVDFVAMNSQDFDAYRPLYPNLRDGLTLAENDAVSWAFIKSADGSLYDAAQDFLTRKQSDGTLERLAAFYSTGDAFNGFGVKSFHRDIAQRLPLYQKEFQKESNNQGLDWRLLAAIAYQESKWDTNASSSTGVKGIMMLTADTAEALGVDNRNHAAQSIRGGSVYFKKIMDNLPTSVPEPDRTWMALAAYNMGPGHMIAARKLTLRLKGNPNSWLDVSRNLRQLALNNKRLNKPAPDVGQALHYVMQVRRYYDAIAINTAEHSATLVASLDLKYSSIGRQTR